MVFTLGPDGALILGSLEFAHLHRPSDGSMQMLLPSEFSTVALDKGWGIIHPLTGSISGENSDYVMICGPRDEDELQAIWIIAEISYYHARGRTMDPKTSTAITPATLGRVKDSLRSASPGRLDAAISLSAEPGTQNDGRPQSRGLQYRNSQYAWLHMGLQNGTPTGSRTPVARMKTWYPNR